MESKKPMTIWEKLENMDVRYIYLLMWVAISLPILRPIGIPLGRYSIETLGLYNFIDKLPPGSIVVFIDDQSPAAAAECHPAEIAIFQHCVNKGLKVLFYASRAEAVPFIESTLQKVLGASKDHPDYGKKYVNLGFIPQYEVGLAALAANMFYTVKDAYGNDIKTLPFFQNLPTGTAKDWAIVIYYGASSVDWVVRQITDVYGTKTGGGVAAVLSSRIYPYFPDKVVGFTNGLKGAAEYEILVKRPGDAAAGMDAQSLGHLVIVIFIILGNLGYFISKRRRM
ncbi:MAG: hypothetical protein QXK51_10875 [Candidatus Methanomethylicia archaeon]